MRDGEGYILGTFELKKSLKIDIIISLCDYSAHKKVVSRKFSGLLKIICEMWEQMKFANFLKNREGQSDV